MTPNKKLVLNGLFAAIFFSTINEIFTYVVTGTAIGKVVSMADELYTIFLLFYTYVVTGKLKHVKILWAAVVFSICGLLGNVLNHTTIMVAIMGLFNTMKPVIVFYCLCQYDFEWRDFYGLMKKFTYFFPVIAISYVLDLFFPMFRISIGLFDLEYRAGIRSLGGLFVKQTNGILWALVYYIFYKYYAVRKHKLYYYISIVAIFMSLKVKDILGFCVAYFFTLFKKVRVKYLFIGAPVMIALFVGYMTLMPEHYAEYFESDGDDSNVARVALNVTSLKIGIDHIPFGVGFGQFGSPTSRDYDSNVYSNYGIDMVYGLTNREGDPNYMCDTFWPMILGETGILGVAAYLWLLFVSFGPFLKRFINNTHDINILFPCFLFIYFLTATIGKPMLVGPPHSFVLWGLAGLFYSLCNASYDDVTNRKLYNYHQF